MTNTNLIPTPIVDKNGKQTTVRKKPQPAATGKAVPAPTVVTPEEREQKKLVRSIIKVLGEHDRITNSRDWVEHKKTIGTSLRLTTDREYLKRLHELSTVMTENSQINDLWQLIRVLAKDDKDTINAMHAHRDWIVNNSGRVSWFVTLQQRLSLRGIRADNTGKIPHIELHLHATMHYNKHRHQRTAYALVPQYEFNNQYMIMVEQHADHIDALLTYRGERGLEAAPDGPAPLDEQDFAEYLQHHNVKDGWL